MGHFLDKLPLDWSEQPLQELHDLLYRTFWERGKITDVVWDSGLEPGIIMWDQSARLIWREVLSQARLQGVHRALLARVKARAPQAADRIDELLSLEPVVAVPDAAGSLGTLWTGFSADGSDERLIAEDDNTLLGIAFLRAGLDVARAVCRLRVVLHGSVFYGSAFHVGHDLLLTNHHVLHDGQNSDEPAAAAEAWFNYELDWNLQALTHCPIECDPASIVGDKEHDWAVIRAVSPVPAPYPPVDLRSVGQIRTNDRVYIIQHPDGLPKMIGMHHNIVRHLDDDVLQYWTDTKPGSSGSPVFDERWRIVGLHHRWVKNERNGTVEYRNQGRRIEKVIERMRDMGVEAAL